MGVVGEKVGITLDSLALAYVEQRRQCGELSASSASNIGYTLQSFARSADVAPSEVAFQHVERWLAESGWAPATARARLSQLRCWCRWMVRRGHVPVDPTLEIRGPRQPLYMPRGLPRKQVESTFASCPDARAVLMVSLMVQEALRCCEVARLQLGDIDPDERLLLVRGKGRRERVLPISDETWAALERYLDESPANAGPLIRSYSHPERGLGAHWVSHLVSEWMHIGGSKGTAHAARHTAATDMLRSGAPLRDVQAALGHASLATTQRYLPWLVGDLRSAMGGRHYRQDEPVKQRQDETA